MQVCTLLLHKMHHFAKDPAEVMILQYTVSQLVKSGKKKRCEGAEKGAETLTLINTTLNSYFGRRNNNSSKNLYIIYNRQMVFYFARYSK